MRVLIASIALAAAAASDGFAAERHVVPGRDVAIWNVAGTAVVEPGTGSEVVVLLERGGRDAAELDIATGPIRGRSTLRVIYPGTKVVYADGTRGLRTTLQVARDGTFNSNSLSLTQRRMTVSSSGSGLEAHADLTVQVPPGRTVALYVGAGPITATNVDGQLRLDGGSSEVRASGCRGSLVVDTGSGTVSVSDHSGDLSADTGSGDVRVERQRGERLHVDTGSGSCVATSIATRSLHVDTGSGDVRVDGTTADDVHVDTGSGSVWLELDALSPRVVVDTGSGGVELGVRDSFSAMLRFETGSGRITSDLPVSIQTREHDSLHARVGGGRGSVHVDTGSGDVRLRRLASR